MGNCLTVNGYYFQLGLLLSPAIHPDDYDCSPPFPYDQQVTHANYSRTGIFSDRKLKDVKGNRSRIFGTAFRTLEMETLREKRMEE